VQNQQIIVNSMMAESANILKIKNGGIADIY